LISKLAKFKQMHYLKKALLSLENIKDGINFLARNIIGDAPERCLRKSAEK